MKELTQKYKMNNLTPEELRELRKKMDSLTNEELEEVLRNDWYNYEGPTDIVNDMRMENIKKRVHQAIRNDKTQRSWIVWLMRAAAILLPLFIVSTFYLYQKNNRIMSDETIVMTGKGERANIILPDGTKVLLNYLSQVKYTPKTFNKNKREIQFDGEGYFQVTKDKVHPFVIHGIYLEINVLGTKFNLLARQNDTMAELTLEEGIVKLASRATGKEILMYSNQKAILNYQTGEITLSENDNQHEIASWKSGNLFFHNDRLEKVLKVLEDNYDYQFRLDEDEYLQELFTGTLPTANFNEALEILKKSYHFDAIIKDKEVLLKPLQP